MCCAVAECAVRCLHVLVQSTFGHPGQGMGMGRSMSSDHLPDRASLSSKDAASLLVDFDLNLSLGQPGSSHVYSYGHSAAAGTSAARGPSAPPAVQQPRRAPDFFDELI